MGPLYIDYNSPAFQSLDGFALAVAADGRFLYISETVSIYLGLSQVSARFYTTYSNVATVIHHGRTLSATTVTAYLTIL